MGPIHWLCTERVWGEACENLGHGDNLALIRKHPPPASSEVLYGCAPSMYGNLPAHAAQPQDGQGTADLFIY